MISHVRLPRSAELWLPGYVRSRAFTRRSRRAAVQGPTDILFCVADHYEPDHGNADAATEHRRVQRWVDEYPKLAAAFTDADGRHPQHSFFSPLEVYREEHIDALAELCRAGYGEVEVHLHHGHDTSANVRRQLEWFKETLAVRHGLLGRDSRGDAQYGFIHGNWALDNGRLDARWCGVNDELTVLRETGCYADFTMPAAPDPAQSRTVNSIYYAVDDPQKPRSYDGGGRARVHGTPAPDALLMVQGPLMLRWDKRARGIFPRVDNSALDDSLGHHPTLDRFRVWVDAGIAVEGRPEWVFVKVHTHGAKEPNAAVLLGDVMHRFHSEITRHFNDGTRYRLHYVTAREMYNIVKAAEHGLQGNPGDYRDYLLRPATDRRSERNHGSAPRPQDAAALPVLQYE